MIYKKIESGKQLGIDKRIEKYNGFYWYSYVVQKIDDTYIVYECEIAENNMAMEEYEYENVNKLLVSLIGLVERLCSSERREISPLFLCGGVR